MKEPTVEMAVRGFLYTKGFGKKKKLKDCVKKLHERGVDIKVKKLRPKPIGWYYLVECKGDPGKKAKAHSGWRSSALNSALGQIISRMHTDRKSPYGGYNYGIAFPVSFEKTAFEPLTLYSIPKRKDLTASFSPDNIT